MKKYCLTREHNNSKWYFTGKVRGYDGKYDYWEGSSLTPSMETNIWDSYSDALLMQIECLFVKGRLYKIPLVP